MRAHQESDKLTDPYISVVVPVYGCAECLVTLCARLEKSLASITRRYEIILVDDRSPDNAWPVISALRQQFSAVRGIRLSRNFGQHVAITAGLTHAQGDYAVVMDCDLQDPPEKIAELYAKAVEGYDVVLGRRIQRNHSLFRTMSARVYFFMMNAVADDKADGSYGTFSLISRKVIDAFLQFSERERHYLFVLRWLGFQAASVDYVHEERAIGHSSYTFKALINHALDGMLFQTTAFLRWIAITGLVSATLGVGAAGYLTYRYFALAALPGWTSLVVLILVCTGMILVGLGIMGIYVGKIFDQVKQRPLYVIETILDGDSSCQ